MKSSLTGRRIAIVIAAFLSCASVIVAQPAAGPLDIQGLDQSIIAGIRSRAMGGTAVANANDASALFTNPAALSRLTSFEVRIGGLVGFTNRMQTQEWVPMRPIPGLSVLFEGLTGNIKTPDSLGIPGLPLSAWSKLQKQYDTITPNWEKSSSRAQPLSLAASMPLAFADIDITAGIGVARAIDLDQFYQNNNSMNPYLGQQRPDPHLITDRNDTLNVQWYQFARSREGSVYGITPGIAVTLLPGLTLGGSASILFGSSDDNEYRVERGHINIAISNGVGSNFMVDTVYYDQKKVGTSTYSGAAFTLGVHFQQKHYAVGLTVKPPMKLTRTWDRDVMSIDTTRKPFPVRIDNLTSRSYHESGKDYLDFPFAYSLGVVLTPTERWTIAFDYDMRRLADMELTSLANSTPTRPWANKSATMRLGAEFHANDMIALRAGYRDDIQAFSPDGSAIVGEPARGGVYSLGGGITVGDIVLDFAYEYARLKYQDIYQSNVNYNTQERHQFMVEIAFRQ